MKQIFNHARVIVVTANDPKNFILDFKRLIGTTIGKWFGKNFFAGENRILFKGPLLKFWYMSIIEVIQNGEIIIEQSAKGLIKISYKIDFLSRFISLFFVMLSFAIILNFSEHLPYYFVLLFPIPYICFFILLCTFAYFKFDSEIDHCISDAGGKSL